jgi:hypothetical protein
MGEVTEIRRIKKARKHYVCDWCNEQIEAGSPYSAWFCFRERVTARMHPECEVAMEKAGLNDVYDNELPPRGTFRRGCWCEEAPENCLCKADAGEREGGESDA